MPVAPEPVTRGVLSRWPAPWRLAALLAGVLPVSGALRGQPPYRHRYCSAPFLIGLLTGLLIINQNGTWLAPGAIRLYGISSLALAVLFKLVINVPTMASVLLLVAHGSRLPGLLDRTDRLMVSSETADGGRASRLLLAALMAARGALAVWDLLSADDVLAPTLNQLPQLWSSIMSPVITWRTQTLLALDIHLLTQLSAAFDSISEGLERLLAPQPQQPPPDRQLAPVEVTSLHTAAVGEQPKGKPTPPSSSVSESLSALRERYIQAADATAAVSAMYALPTLCELLHFVTLLISALVVQVTPSPPALVYRCVWTTALVALLSHHGQRLQEAASRPARLLLRAAPAADAATEAQVGRLVALVRELQPAFSAGGVGSINGRLLVSVSAGFVTYLVVLLQMT
ncbi:hypothetical protein FJT64_002781 [Amphibalanus amphitrite]|uniref:Uncharacterized protein n=1 Tax=Amphibalanus amphitrite TaxID=1232801 RepID=A0A6A4WKV6_AMPAM|nr:hypothetical protein FJT64_002781 [Amphibalanus amphitrite]